jgi:hypothetical protein
MTSATLWRFLSYTGRWKKEVQMGLVDDVDAELSSDYRKRDSRAVECIHTRRRQLQHNGKYYCLLSNPKDHLHCPLQAEKVQGETLSQCLYMEYMDALHSRRKTGS